MSKYYCPKCYSTNVMVMDGGGYAFSSCKNCGENGEGSFDSISEQELKKLKRNKIIDNILN